MHDANPSLQALSNTAGFRRVSAVGRFMLPKYHPDSEARSDHGMERGKANAGTPRRMADVAYFRRMESRYKSFVSIEQLADKIGETVTLNGWVYDKTEKGKLIFIKLRDGSGTVQGVLFKPNVAEEVFAWGGVVGTASATSVTRATAISLESFGKNGSNQADRSEES